MLKILDRIFGWLLLFGGLLNGAPPCTAAMRFPFRAKRRAAMPRAYRP